MENSKAVLTPLEPGVKLEKNEEIKEEKKNTPYQNLIGSLGYLAVATRPDIAHVVSYLSQFNKNFDKSHWMAAKRVLQYLKNTKDLTLQFVKTNKKVITDFSDADWASCTVDRRSFTGYCFKFAGGAVSWESKKQKTVALSTAEAEYMSLTEAAKEAIHLKQLAKDMGLGCNTITLYNDNQAAQNLATNPIIKARSKHIDIKQHFIREAVINHDVKLVYCPTENMVADVLTKSLSGQKLIKHRRSLGLI